MSQANDVEPKDGGVEVPKFFGLDRSRQAVRFNRPMQRRSFLSHVVAFLREIPSRLWWAWESTRWVP